MWRTCQKYLPSWQHFLARSVILINTAHQSFKNLPIFTVWGDPFQNTCARGKHTKFPKGFECTIALLNNGLCPLRKWHARAWSMICHDMIISINDCHLTGHVRETWILILNLKFEFRIIPNYFWFSRRRFSSRRNETLCVTTHLHPLFLATKPFSIVILQS